MPETSRFDCCRCECPNSIDDMVQCGGGCNGWFHYGCVGFDDGRKQENWRCSNCILGRGINNLTVVNNNLPVSNIPISTIPGSIANVNPTSNSFPTVSNTNPMVSNTNPMVSNTNPMVSNANPMVSNANPMVSNTNTALSNASSTSSNASADRLKLQLELLEEQKSFALRELELQQAQEYERKKLLLDKEAFRVRCDIVRANAGVDINQAGRSGTEPVGDFINRLAQASGIVNPSNPSNAPSSSMMGMQSNSGGTSNPTSMAPTSSYLRDFLPGGGSNQPGSSTPITSSIPALWTDPATSFTTFTQSLPPTISTVRQHGQPPAPTISGTVSQCNQLPNSINQMSLGLGLSQGYQYLNFGAGIGYPQVSQVNVSNPYVPPTFPPYIPNSLPMPTVSQSVPGVSQMELNAPTPRQLAARHVMPKDLPMFSGSPEEWPMFYSAFVTSTEACGYSEVENLGRLQRCLKGSALEAVRSRLLLPSAVPQVMQTLQLLYGRPEQIIYALLAKVREAPAPKADNLKTLVTFGMAVQNFCDHLVAAGQMVHLSNPMLLQELVDKLPAHLKLDWAMYKRQFMVVDLRAFGAFMTNLVSAAAEVTLTLDAGGSKAGRVEKAKGFLNAHAEAEPVTATQEQSKAGNFLVRCLVCSNPDHRVKECEQFKRMSGEDKWKAVQTHQLCRVCLGKHGRKPCRSQTRCEVQGCQLRHHPLLHSGSTAPASTTSASSGRSDAVRVPSQVEGLNAHRDGQGMTLFRILPVTLFANGNKVDTYAFIDEGSSVTLLEKWIADELEVKGVKKRLCLSWTGNVTREEEDSHQITIEVAGSDSDRRFTLEDVRTVKSLALPTQSLRYSELAERYQHLRKLPVTDYDSVTPGILIGAGHTPLTATKQLREGRTGEPVAAKTRLGWAVYGSLQEGVQNQSFNLHICDCSMDARLHDLVKQYFTVENVGVSADCGPESEEEKRARSILQETTRRVGNGFESGLLWRHEYVEFPDSYPMAVRRLQCFERRLKSNPVINESVRRQIIEYQQKGYIHEAKEEELRSADPRRVWYLPVSVVQNPKKPSKIRLVWDAAAKVDGISLNTMLMKGPDLVVPLPTVLYGFRERRVALGGDLQEMFHQVKIRPEDRNSQRFLWRDDPTQQPRIFIMDVATFGSTSSPCSAQYVKNLNAQEHADQYPRAAEAIQRRHYVDDYLDSFDSEEEACQVAEEVKKVHKQGGFNIRNWLSNSSEVLRRVGAPDGLREKSVDADKTKPVERVLGMLWMSEPDVFVYANGLELSEVVPTKRGILRCVMSQYDPLGLLSHFLIHGRVIIQDIWRTKAGWDDTINEEILQRWRNWTGLFEELKKVCIPRAYFPDVRSEEIEDLQLHVFVDASESAYSCVAYFRARIRGEHHTALVGAKSKVSPLKSLSVPRLELQAAIIGCRLMKTLCTSHSLPIKRRVFWTDSKTVLAWIHSDHRRYRQFVACRIGEILSKSNAEEWMWIPTKQNVADEATKWGKGPSLEPESRWFTGPQFLRGPEAMWPRQPETVETPEELKPSPCLVQFAEPRQELIDWSRFSKFERLWRAVAHIYRYVGNFRRKQRGQPPEQGHLTREELNRAQNTLWRLVQEAAFPDEVAVLRKVAEGERTMKLEKTSRIAKLSPFMDNGGVVRMDSRLSGASFVSFDAQFPIILPKNHPLTTLLLDWHHRAYLHANNETVVNEVRQRFHVPSLRTQVRKVAGSCMQCKIKKAKPSAPRMAPLPDARLSPFVRPFSYVGLDYFGPMQVKIGRSLVKRWAALFTCLTIRAVHLEVVHSLSTTSCKMAIRRFLVRHGSPLEIWSDNGTNFRGASRELKEQLEQVHGQLSAIFTNTTTKWVFNPPAAPHMGGSWERLVRSIKTAFAGLSITRNPDDETLLTLLVEAEGVVNSRPLTFVPLESEAQESLTPNHFLLLSSQGVVQPPEPLTDRAEALRSNWKLMKSLVDEFWHRWVKEYLPTIATRTKWTEESRELTEGDLVLVVDESTRNGWQRGRVLSVVRGRDGRVRQAFVKTQKGVMRRPATKIAALEIQDAANQQELGNAGQPGSADQHYGSGNVAAERGCLTL